MASIRHRSSKVHTIASSGNLKVDAKNGEKRFPYRSLAFWATSAVAVVIVIRSTWKVSHNAGSIGLLRQPSNIFSMELDADTGNGKKKTPCPNEYKRKFWMEMEKINQPVARALRLQGWERSDNHKHAQVIWTYVSKNSWYDKLEPWQRYNHIPKYKLFNQKDSFVTYMNAYADMLGKNIAQIPETYRLEIDSDRDKFKDRLFNQGGINVPWVLKKPRVNQGRGITMLGPNTNELKNVLNTVKDDKDVKDYIIQRYVCNEMTINQRKFDFRVFWIVASLDPLIVMSHTGYLRIGNSEYNEQDFSNTRAHLTTHTGLAAEGKGTWHEFGQYLSEAVRNNNKLKHIKNPLMHVKNQVKQVLGDMAAAFKDVTLNANEISADNGFAFYGADFIIDWDLDIFFIEPQHGCGLDEDFQFRVDMHNALFSDMIIVSEEIWERQERGLSTDNDSIKNVGGLEFVYNDGWMFRYSDYIQVQDKRGCEPPSKQL